MFSKIWFIFKLSTERDWRPIRIEIGLWCLHFTAIPSLLLPKWDNPAIELGRVNFFSAHFPPISPHPSSRIILKSVPRGLRFYSRIVSARLLQPLPQMVPFILFQRAPLACPSAQMQWLLSDAMGLFSFLIVLLITSPCSALRSETNRALSLKEEYNKHLRPNHKGNFV